jgi:hypothetical protein
VDTDLIEAVDLWLESPQPATTASVAASAALTPRVVLRTADIPPSAPNPAPFPD